MPTLLSAAVMDRDKDTLCQRG